MRTLPIGAPTTECDLKVIQMEQAVEHIWISSFAHALQCHYFAANRACASSFAQAQYIARETITTVGYGTISPDAWGGDAGYCHKPSARRDYLQLREARVGAFNVFFEWLLWKNEWTSI